MIAVCQCIAYERGQQRVSGVCKFILFGVFTLLGWLIYKFSNVNISRRFLEICLLCFKRTQQSKKICSYAVLPFLGKRGWLKPVFQINLLNCMFFKSTGAPAFQTFNHSRLQNRRRAGNKCRALKIWQKE